MAENEPLSDFWWRRVCFIGTTIAVVGGTGVLCSWAYYVVTKNFWVNKAAGWTAPTPFMVVWGIGAAIAIVGLVGWIRAARSTDR